MFVFMILMGLEVDAKACRDGRSKGIHVRAKEEQPAAADDKEQVIRQEQFYSKMQPATPDKARTALCSLSMSAFDWRTLVASIRIFSRTSGWISPDKTLVNRMHTQRAINNVNGWWERRVKPWKFLPEA